MEDHIKRKKILITGINGFIGSNIAKLLKEKYVIVGLDTGSVDAFNLSDFYVQMILPNSDIEGLMKTFEPDYCIHCAGSASVGTSITNPGVDFNSGPTVVFQLLDSIRKSRINCRFIFLSSAAVYGNPAQLPIDEETPLKPISPYGYHKMISEQLIEEFAVIYGIEYVILRIFSCFGEGLKKQLLWDIAGKLKQSNKINLFGTGDETRDFINVIDLALAINVILTSDKKNEVFNIANGKQVKISEIANYMCKHYSTEDKDVVYNNEVRIGDPLYWQADISKISRLGFVSSIDLEEGIKRYCQWVKSL